MKRLGVFLLPPGWDASPSQGYPQHFAVTHLYTRGLFLKSPESFRAYFGCHNSLYIFATPTFQAIKLRNPLSFSYIKNMLKDQLFKIGRLQLDDWLFGPEKFSGLLRNRPLARVARSMVTFILKKMTTAVVVYETFKPFSTRRYARQIEFLISSH